MKLVKQILSLGLAGLLILNIAPWAWSQTPQGKLELNGQVIDQNKAAITGAQVTLVDESGKNIVTKSDNQGRFHFTNLDGGTYTLNVFADKFDVYNNEEFKLDKALSEPLVITLAISVNDTINVKEDSANSINVDMNSNGSSIVLNAEDLE